MPCAGSEPSGAAQRATTLGLLLALAALPLGCTRDTGSSARDAGSPPRDLTVVGADSLLGDIRRVARFDAAPSTLAVPGLVPGRPFVAIVVAVPADASERPGDQGDTYEIVCFLGRMPLTRVPRPELADAVLLVGPDPGDDTAGEPVWCARRSRVPAAKGSTTALEAEYQSARERPRSARWLRGADGRRLGLETIAVPSWRPGEALPDPIGRWLGEGEGRAR